MALRRKPIIAFSSDSGESESAVHGASNRFGGFRYAGCKAFNFWGTVYTPLYIMGPGRFELPAARFAGKTVFLSDAFVKPISRVLQPD